MKRILYNSLIIVIAFIISACGQSDDPEAIGEKVSDETIDSSEPISDDYSPEEIAHILVRQVLKQEALDSSQWDMLENEVYAKYKYTNVINDDKPYGDIQIVWVIGKVQTTVDGKEQEKSFELELYKQDTEESWYIGAHEGILQSIDIPEMPQTDQPEERYVYPYENSHEAVDNPDEQYFQDLEAKYLQYVYDHFVDVGLMEYMEDEQFTISKVEVDKQSSSSNATREYHYYIDASLDETFATLAEVEQYDILAEITVADYFQYYEGHRFSVPIIQLFTERDLYLIASRIVSKNDKNLIDLIDLDSLEESLD